jgi:hypothetical protein
MMRRCCLTWLIPCGTLLSRTVKVWSSHIPYLLVSIRRSNTSCAIVLMVCPRPLGDAESAHPIAASGHYCKHPYTALSYDRIEKLKENFYII